MLKAARPLKVFLCHASADKPAARKLYRYLRSKGMDPWLDVENLIPGQLWEEEIPKALYNSDAIVVIISRNSITKEGYVQREIKFALDKALDMPEGRIFLIPARLEECDLPRALKGYQWVDLFQKNWTRRLMLSLNQRIAELDLTPLLVPQKEIQTPPTIQEDSSPVNTDEPVLSGIPETSGKQEPVYLDEDTQKEELLPEQSGPLVAGANQTVSSGSSESRVPEREQTKISRQIEPPFDQNDSSPSGNQNKYDNEHSNEEQVEPHILPDLTKDRTKSPERLIGILGIFFIVIALFIWREYSISANERAESTVVAEEAYLTEQAATFRVALTQTVFAQSLISSPAPTTTQTSVIPSFTFQPGEPTAIVAIIRVSEGGGAFIREEPAGKVLVTLTNGAWVYLLASAPQEQNGVMWVHVFTTINNKRYEGWMIQSAVQTATPSAD